MSAPDIKGHWVLCNKTAGDMQTGFKTDFSDKIQLVNLDTGAVLCPAQGDTDTTYLEVGSLHILINKSFADLRQKMEEQNLILEV